MLQNLPNDDLSKRAPHPATTLAKLGALIGDPVRASILFHLSDGSRRPAGELSQMSGVSPQAGSAHLAQLVEGGLLGVEKVGRHRFYAIASGEIAEVIESLVNWIEEPRQPSRHDPTLCAARFCYDHLAGRLGVSLFDGMNARGFFAFGVDGVHLSAVGRDWCRCNGLPVEAARPSRRPLVRLCQDWTERRPHLGGLFGAALARKMIDDGCLVPGSKRRAVIVTAKGARFFRDEFAIRP